MKTNTREQSKTGSLKKPLAKKTRQDQLKAILSRKTGASISQIQDAFGWQPHTARAALSMLRKAGVRIERSATTAGSTYRITKKA